MKVMSPDMSAVALISRCYTGKNPDEVVSNLKEAIELHFEGENPAEMGYVENPAILITYEVDAVYARA